MTIKISKTESKLVVTSCTRTCDECGKTDNYGHFSVEDDGKPWECNVCYEKRINEVNKSKNQELVGATVTSFDVNWGYVTRIKLKTKDGKELIVNTEFYDGDEDH